MNKGSHISLAYFLMNDIPIFEFRKQRKAFLVGSILPDCLPSFLTTRHIISDTLDYLENEIQKVCDELLKKQEITPYCCRHLGVICHYLADYFTFPHNPGFQGSMKDHYNYEKKLLVILLDYLKQREVEVTPRIQYSIKNSEDICHYIALKHKEYLETPHDILVDCRYIADICSSILNYILEYTNLMYSIVRGGQIEAA